MKVKHLKDSKLLMPLLIAVFTGIMGGLITEYGIPKINSRVIFNFGLVFSGLCYGTLFFIWKKIDKMSREANVKKYGELVDFEKENFDLKDLTKDEFDDLVESKMREIEIDPKYLKVIVLPLFLLSLAGTMVTILYAESLSGSYFIKIIGTLIIGYYVLGWVMYGFGLKS